MSHNQGHDIIKKHKAEQSNKNKKLVFTLLLRSGNLTALEIKDQLDTAYSFVAKEKYEKQYFK
jgi:hypothetical protein